MTTPRLSVCVITYNHVRYLYECLQSVVDQETNFEFEVLVGDDCSSDGTQKIIDHFCAEYPAIFKSIKHSVKVGGTENLFSVHRAAVGEFVAHLDGDDVMLPGKLQRQVEFLSQRPDHAFVAHDVQIIDENSRVLKESFYSGAVPESANLDYLVEHGCFFTHSSKMYRRSAAQTQARDRPTVDLYLHLEHARSGRVGYISQKLGSYRRTSVGLSSSQSLYRRDVLSGHLDAYAYALRSGVSAEVVNRARLNFRYVHAMRCARARQSDEYMLLAAIGDDEWCWATFRQRLFFAAPRRIVWWAVASRDAVRRVSRVGIRSDRRP